MSEKWKSSPPRIYFNRSMFSPSFILCKIVFYSFAAVHMHFHSLTCEIKKNAVLLDYFLWCFSPGSDHSEFAVIVRI